MRAWLVAWVSPEGFGTNYFPLAKQVGIREEDKAPILEATVIAPFPEMAREQIYRSYAKRPVGIEFRIFNECPDVVAS